MGAWKLQKWAAEPKTEMVCSQAGVPQNLFMNRQRLRTSYLLSEWVEAGERVWSLFSKEVL